MRNGLIFALAALMFAAAPAASETVVTDHAESALYPVEQGFAPGRTTWFVFEQTLQTGWHVYWKNPGDSGLPLELQWTLPEGFEAGAIVYPTPEKIPVGPLANYGHHGAPVFLIPVSAPDNAVIGETADIGLKATWLICEEICVPEEGVFALSLPVEAAPSIHEEAAATADAARAAAPQSFDAQAEFSVSNDSVVLSLRAPDDGDTDGYFLPDFEGLIEPAAPPRIARRGDR
ncbi:MAG: protein-disulfide reductase DsbD family protein [Amphiplicatus sp.]